MTLEMLNTIHDVIGNESINAQIEMDDMIQSYMESASEETMKEVYVAAFGETILQGEEFKQRFRRMLPELWHIISMDLDEQWNDLADYRRRCDDVLEYLKSYDFT